MGARPRKPLAKCSRCGYLDRLNDRGYCDGCRRAIRSLEDTRAKHLFDDWSFLNAVIADDRSRFDELRLKFRHCNTKAKALQALREEHYDTRYPLLPTWLI